MSYASAGHPPPVVAGPNTPAHSLAYGGLPFGVGIPVASQTRHVTLERDAAVLFYTDGLTEFRRNIDGAESAVLRAMTRLVEEEPSNIRPNSCSVASWVTNVR